MDYGGMSVLAHVKVTPGTIPQLGNRPIMMALLDQCVNYYYSNWPLGLKGCGTRGGDGGDGGTEARPIYFTSSDRTRGFFTKEGEDGDNDGRDTKERQEV